jgi:predicted nucleic acid-binding Zn ribbon protein
MPRYDFKCDNGHVREDVWVSMFRDAGEAPVPVPPCEECGAAMHKQPAAPNFTIGGFNAKNGYSSKG